jgi:hypothetical protein
MLFCTAQFSIKKRACGRRKIKENKNEFNIIISYIYYLLFLCMNEKTLNFFIYIVIIIIVIIFTLDMWISKTIIITYFQNSFFFISFISCVWRIQFTLIIYYFFCSKIFSFIFTIFSFTLLFNNKLLVHIVSYNTNIYYT